MNTTAQEEIVAYVEAVREALVGLPEDTRRELVEDLPEHLAEVLAEGSGSLVDRLGPPQFYAAELRAATGFVGGFPDPPPPADRMAQLWTAVSRRLDAADVRVGPLLGHARASEFLTLLRPAWWVLRGYLAAMVLAYVLDDSGQPIGLLPRIGGSEAVALLLLAGGVLGSIWLGRRTAELTVWPRYAVRSGTVLLTLVALTLFLNADQSSRGAIYQDAGYSNPYGGVEDVYVYDEHGRLLTNVQLLDQNGSPIRLGTSWCSDTGESVTDGRLYPHCPQNAPFRSGASLGGELTPGRSAPTPTAPTPTGPTPTAPTPTGPTPTAATKTPAAPPPPPTAPPAPPAPSTVPPSPSVTRS